MHDAKLITGIPATFGLIKPPKSIPFEVCIALMQATINNELNDFTPREKRIIIESFDEARKEMETACHREKIKDKRKMVLGLTNGFAARVNKDKKLISKICFIYWEEFTSYFDREIRRRAEEAEGTRAGPDCSRLLRTRRRPQ